MAIECEGPHVPRSVERPRASTPSRAPLVGRKVVPPGLPKTTVHRPRLDDLYARLLEEHEALAVFAAAGSGKTVQAQLFARQHGWRVAWLTLDGADRSPSRMLSYLGAALGAHVRVAEEVAGTSFGESPVFEEVAAVLAASIDVDRLLVVLDQCEHVADSTRSCAILETFLDYLPGGTRALLLSRSEMQFSIARLLLQGRMGRVGDADLALTADEAAALVQARGEDPTRIEQRWTAARGWLAAVAFGGADLPGPCETAGDFQAYLHAEVLDALAPRERRFLLDTSVLEVVSRRAATTICGPEAHVVWREIGMRHIPATTSPDGAIVYHPCFRDFLRNQLEQGEPHRLRALQERHAAFLLESRQFEEAVELLLALRLLDDAADAACIAAVESLVDRADWETFLRWVETLGEARVLARPVLVAAFLRSLRGSRRLREARELARRLDDAGNLAAVVEADPGVVAHVAWAMLWQPAEGLALLDRYGGDRWSAGVRYMLEVTSGTEPVAPPQGSPSKETDRVVSWALMVQGRIDDLLAMLPEDDQWPPRSPYTTPHPILGMVWRGEVARARELFEQVPEDVKQRIHTDLWHYLEAWLLLVEGDAYAAAVAAERAVVHSRRTGFGFEPVFEIVQAQALLDLGRGPEAVSALDESLRSCEAAGLRAYVEWARTVLGRARLLDGDDAEALGELHAAVAGMTRSGRLLMLPMAATYLAEAERRLGSPGGADAAAAAARMASETMGSFKALQIALGHFPGVLDDQLRRHPEDGWQRLAGTAPRPSPARRAAVPSVPTPVEIRPFGSSPAIVVNGVETTPRRVKVLELACFLAAHPSGASRDDVQLSLFPDSDRRRGSNHFRQVVHQLRKSTGLTLQRPPDGRIIWADGLVVDALDRRFERAVTTARGLPPADRLPALRDALALVAGPYLPASDLEWASERRFQLDVLFEEASIEMAQLSIDLGAFDLVRDRAEAVLERNPYSEPAYRALIRTELAVGTESAALATYRRAVTALREIGLEPGLQTVSLLTSPMP